MLECVFLAIFALSLLSCIFTGASLIYALIFGFFLFFLWSL